MSYRERPFFRRCGGRSRIVLLASALGALGGRAPVIGAEKPAQGTAAPPAAADEIHWTILGERAVAVEWRGGGTTLTFWRAGSPAAAARTVTATSVGPHRTAVLDSLARGTAYDYRVAGQAPGGEPGVEPVFRTPPTSCEAKFTFAAEGDIGASSRSPESPMVQRLIARAKPRFVLGLGDLAYANGNDALVQRHLDDVMIWSLDAAYMPAWGNHDWMYGHGGDLAMYKERFTLPHAQASPGAPAAGCCGNDWSWFDYGCLRVITYPEPYRSETWQDWGARAEPIFAAAEADPRIHFIVTAGHRPAYTSGGHHGEVRLRRIVDLFGARFDKYVMNLAGHNHDYERTVAEHGVVHLTVGTGGARLERAETACGWPACQSPDWIRFRAFHHGAALLTVSATRITGKFVCGAAGPDDDVKCAPGTVLDTFVITRRPAVRHASTP